MGAEDCIADCPERFLFVQYTWELQDSTGIVRLAIDPECPVHGGLHENRAE